MYQSEHEKKVYRITEANTWIPHAHALPTEVLAKIFIEYSLPVVPVVYLPPRRSLYPWRLGHVCSQWREALWSSPDIWSTVKITEPEVRTPDREYETLVWNILDDILSRTTGVISLSIHRSSYSSAGVSNIIRSFSHRLRRLTLFSTPHDSFRTLLELTPGSLQYLEDLFLFNFGSNVRLSTLNFSTDNTHMDLPSLRTLVIDGRASIAPYLPHFPLSQLIRLEVKGFMMSPTIAHFVLQQCSSLLFAKFSICKDVPGSSDYRTTGTILSTLKHIDLSVYFHLDWDTFLRPLEFPLLSTFASSDYSGSPTGHSPTFSSAMISLLNRSKCSLDSFSISYHFESLSDTAPPHPDIRNLLQIIPGLTEFASGYIAAPAFIHLAHGSLKQLRRVDWRLEPDGLCTFLDFLDNHIAQPSSSREFPTLINIVCCNADGFSSARMRYIKSYPTYEDAGIDITVRDVKYDDIRFMDEHGTDDDQSDVSSVWAAGLGDSVLERPRCCCIQ